MARVSRFDGLFEVAGVIEWQLPVLSSDPCILYTDEGFAGIAFQLFEPGEYRADAFTLPPTRIRSMSVGPGFRATIFEEDEFQGRSISFPADGDGTSAIDGSIPVGVNLACGRIASLKVEVIGDSDS